jgi:lambda family phage tail tape measure protein
MATREARNFSYRLSVENAPKAEKDFKDVGAAAEKGLGKIDQGSRKAAESLEKTSQSANKTKTTIVQLKQTSSELEKVFKRFASFAIFGEFTRNTIQTGLAFERLQIGLNSAFGSVEKGKDEFRFLAEELDRLGLPIISTADAYSKLASSAKETALEGQGVRDLFIGLTEAASVYRLSQEQINGVFKAYTDSISKGFIQMEELKGQLGDRLPGVLRLTAKGLGVTTAELVKMVETGKLATEEVLPAFNNALREDVAGGLKEATGSAQSSINRFYNSIDRLQIAFTESGFLDSLSQFITLLTQFLTDPQVQSGAEKLGTFFGYFDKKGAFTTGVAGIQHMLSGDYSKESGETPEERLNSFLDAVADERDPFVQREILPKVLLPKKTVTNKGDIKSSKTSDVAKETIDNLNEEIDLIKELGDTSVKTINSQLSLNKSLSSIEKRIASEQKSNSDITISFTNAQRETIKSLLQEKQKLLDAQKKEEEFVSILADIKEEYTELTPSVLDNIDAITLWRNETLSALDETDARYSEFSAMVEELYRDKIKTANDEALESSDGLLAGLQRGMKSVASEATTFADDIENAYISMSEGMNDALFSFVEEGKFNLESLRSLAADVLSDVAKGIFRRGVTDQATGFLGSFVSSFAGSLFGGGGIGAGSFEAPVGAVVAHTGGVIGFNANNKRDVPASLFTNAPRFHNGLLRSDEVPTILQRGERVIPKNAEIGGSNLTINIYAQDADSVIKNRGQVGSALFNEMARSRRRNG